jgi:hypothetical protein
MLTIIRLFYTTNELVLSIQDLPELNALTIKDEPFILIIISTYEAFNHGRKIRVSPVRSRLGPPLLKPV